MIIVEANQLVSQLGQTSGCYQPDVTRTYDSYLHLIFRNSKVEEDYQTELAGEM
jgi:hypothetical protein